jgi:hypothetical protein
MRQLLLLEIEIVCRKFHLVVTTTATAIKGETIFKEGKYSIIFINLVEGLQ